MGIDTFVRCEPIKTLHYQHTPVKFNARLRVVKIKRNRDDEEIVCWVPDELAASNAFDENNNYAKNKPDAYFEMVITNPAFRDRMKEGQVFDVKFTEVKS